MFERTETGVRRYKVVVYLDAPTAPEDKVAAAVEEHLHERFGKPYVESVTPSRLDVPSYDTDCPPWDVVFPRKNTGSQEGVVLKPENRWAPKVKCHD